MCLDTGKTNLTNRNTDSKSLDSEITQGAGTSNELERLGDMQRSQVLTPHAHAHISRVTSPSSPGLNCRDQGGAQHDVASPWRRVCVLRACQRRNTRRRGGACDLYAAEAMCLHSKGTLRLATQRYPNGPCSCPHDALRKRTDLCIPSRADARRAARGKRRQVHVRHMPSARRNTLRHAALRN